MSQSLDYLMTKFENKLLKSNGNEFQGFFYKIMKIVDNDFIEIKPHGNIGDRKCDGYIKRKGIFYQVYGPENPDKKDTINKAKAKLLADFEGLYKTTVVDNFYEEIKEFYYVFNNKTIAVMPPIFDTELRMLEEKYKKIKFGYISNNDLKHYFLKLDTVSQKTILECYIDFDLIHVKYDIIGNVVMHLSKNVFPTRRKETLIVPDFDEKIEFNRLSPQIKIQLSAAYLHIGELEDFLNSYYNRNIKHDLKNIYSELYSNAKSHYPKDTIRQFYYIIENSIPNNIKDSDHILQQNLYEQNILIVMSKYFESCDIFEEPTLNEQIQKSHNTKHCYTENEQNAL